MEPVSPELVLVSPELRGNAPYGPYVPRRPAYVEPFGVGVSVAASPTVDLTFHLPVVLVAVVGAVAKMTFEALVVIGGAAVVVASLFLLARW